MQEKIRKFFTLEYIFVLLLLLVAFVVRVFRVDQILGFYYDQGRDALVIWDLINSPHKFFLIGPTTGLAGVFRGPFYYYLIAPFYYLGRGNPIYPEIFLAVLSTAALLLMYLIGKEIGGKRTGFISLILGAFSFEIIYASRWLSNPTPMLLLSMLLVWSMFKIQDGKKYFWVLLALVLGLSFFNFGSSGELFYFPAVAIFAVWTILREGFGGRSTLNWKIILLSIGTFVLTFIPLFIFNLKHGGILANNMATLVGNGKSFAIPTWRFALDRLSLVFVYLSSTIFHSPFEKEWFHLYILIALFLYFLSQIVKNVRFKVVLIVLFCPIVGLVFYQGNYGNLYQYYLTGYYLIFLLAVAFLLSKCFESSLIGKAFVVYFIGFFLIQNWYWVRPYINTSGLEPNTIVLSNQKKAIDWVYQNSKEEKFNVDVYVPPVISYSYDYLFKWLGTTLYNKHPVDQQVPLLYTLYEVDPEHPDRLNAWLARQAGIGRIIKEETFGGLTVQERIRINKK